MSVPRKNHKKLKRKQKKEKMKIKNKEENKMYLLCQWNHKIKKCYKKYKKWW